MIFLLDTHTFLWLHDEVEKLSVRAHDALANPENDLYLSIISVWEIQIKLQSKKLKISDRIDKIIDEQKRVNNLTLLPVELIHAVNIINLPSVHKDPFDRMLISQAVVEDMTVVTADPKFSEYGVKVLW